MTDHSWLKTARVMIMTMREDDAALWDPQALAAFAQSFSVDALGFSVGGITAFYPTEISLHPRSPSLGDRDLVGETVQALDDIGLRAIGRIDSSLASKAIFAEHPDWFAYDSGGQPIPVHGAYVTCPNSGYYRDFTLRVVREILERYPLGGLWANAAQFSPWHTRMCFCPSCESKFRDRTGQALPTENWLDPVWRDYNQARYEWMAEWNQMVHETIREVRPTCAWLPLSQVAESWDHARRGGWDIDYTEPHVDGMVLEAQRRYTNMWWPGLEARYLSALNPDKPACVTSSYFLPWWRFYHVPDAENRLWIGQVVAHGAAPWIHVTGFFSDHFDRRGLAPMRELFADLRENAEAYENLASVADVALVYSRHTLDNLDGRDPEGTYLDHFRGAYNAMMAERIPFDVLTDTRLTAESLSRYSTVVLANTACLSDAAIAALLAYAEDGGHVVATFKTGFLDEMGRRREAPALLAALGIEDTGVMRRGMKAGYALIRDADDALLAGMGDTDVLPLEGDLCILRGPGAEVPGPLTFIPPVEGDVGSGFSVPEFNRIDHVGNYPLSIKAVVGKGSILYFPWQPELIAYRNGFKDLFRLIGNAVRMAPDWHDRVTITAPGLLDVAVREDGDRLVLHVLNFSAPGSFDSGQRRIIEEVMPIAGAEVRLRLPAGRSCASARAVVADQDIAAVEEDGHISFTMPTLHERETVLIRLQ